MENFSILSLFWSATLPVKIIILFLIGVSVLSWSIIFQRAMVFRRVAAALRSFNLLLARDPNLLDVYKNIQTKSYTTCAEKFFASGVNEFIAARKQGAQPNDVFDRVSKTLELHEVQEIGVLEQQLSWLATIGSVSPYVGLFGTVWGIMHSFIGLASMSEQVTIATVAPGIAEALIATAIGLFAAIPAVIAFNKYSNNLNFIVNNFDELQKRLLLGLKRI